MSDVRAARRIAVAAQILLLLAALRHHFVWGEVGPYPQLLRRALDGGEALALVLATVLGFVAWRRAGRAAAGASIGDLVRASWPLLVAALVVPPFLSLDVLNYVTRGSVQAIHGHNPYLVLASDLAQGDPMLRIGDPAWTKFPMLYGPLAAELQGAVAWLADVPRFLPVPARVVLGVALFKLCSGAAHVVTAVLAAGLARRLRGPDAAGPVLIAVLWNPLLLIESLGSAHNDAIAACLLVAAVAATVAGRDVVAPVAAGLGALVKFVPAVAGPVLLADALRRRRLVAFAAGCAIVVALGALWYLRFFREPHALEFFSRQSAMGFSRWPWSALPAEGPLAPAHVLTALRALLVFATAWAAWQVWRASGTSSVVARVVVVAATVPLLVSTFTASSQFVPWYHVWWLPLALVLDAGRLGRAARAVTLVAPLSYLVWVGLRDLGPAHGACQLALGLVLPLAWAAISSLRGGEQAPPPAGVS